MAAEVQAYEPERVAAGDTIKWKVSLVDYLPGDGWALSYHILNGDRDLGEHAATDNGDGTHLVTIAAATSAAWVAGDYRYQAYVTKGSERFSVRQGSLTVTPDLATASTHDGRSNARQALDAINACLLRKATKDQWQYSVNGRMLQRYSVNQLMLLKQHFIGQVEAEEAEERVQKGLAPHNRVLTTFSRR